MDWTAEAIDRLRGLWAEGHSTAESQAAKDAAPAKANRRPLPAPPRQAAERCSAARLARPSATAPSFIQRNGFSTYSVARTASSAGPVRRARARPAPATGTVARASAGSGVPGQKPNNRRSSAAAAPNRSATPSRCARFASG